MNNIKISIIIPVYNVEKYIRKALNSIIEQKFQDIEIICINDCSPDQSFEIVKEFAANDPRFVLLEQEKNQGQGIARNRGLEIARGDYIMFLDPDDWYEPDALIKAYRQIEKNKNDFVFFNLYKRYEKNGKLTSKIEKTDKLKCFAAIKDDPHINLAKVEGYFIKTAWTWTQIYSREFLNKYDIRFSEERFQEDLPFFIKAVIYSKDISILDDPLYNYLKKSTGACIDYTQHYKDVLSCKEKTYRIICDSPNKEAYIDKYYYYCIKSNLHWLNNFSQQNKRISEDFFQNLKSYFEKIAAELGENHKVCNQLRMFNLIRKCKNYKTYRLILFFCKIPAYFKYKIIKLLDRQ